MRAGASANRAAPLDGRCGHDTPRLTALVLATSLDAAERTCSSLENLAYKAMVCCDATVALDWLLDHEGFFDCVIVEPELAEVPGIINLINDAHEAGLEIPFLIRTVFPSSRPAHELPPFTGRSFIRRIAMGHLALHASLPTLFQEQHPATSALLQDSGS